MYGWRTTYDAKTRVHKHAVAGGGGHAMFAPLVTHVFKVLRISAAVWEQGTEWWAIHAEPNVAKFELEHGRHREREAYNARHAAKARRRQKQVRGEFAGFSDLFVPIVLDGQAVGVLVTGPFASERPKSTDILERWRWLTDRQGHPSDPAFAAYTSVTLSTLTLEGPKLSAFESLLDSFAELMAAKGRADEVMNRVEPLKRELDRVRFPEHVWDAVSTMLDDRSPRSQLRESRSYQMRYLGLSRITDHVAVGLTRTEGKTVDAVDEAIRRDGFQRASVELAHDTGDALSGRVGDHGVVFLSGSSGPLARKRRKVIDLSEQSARLAQRFGLSLHVGISAASDATSLNRSYQVALGAADSALSQGARIVIDDKGTTRSLHSLRALRRNLDKTLLEHPQLLQAQFDRYLEAVEVTCGYRVESARTHLEVAFERMAEVLVGGGALDPRGLHATSEGLDRAAEAARSMGDLFAAYRGAASDLAAAVKSPLAARHNRGLRSAIEYLEQHYAEPLHLEQVARVAGFAPKYFSRLFKDQEGTTFEKYLRDLRVERAKLLLAGTELDVERVARLAGFSSSQYFCRVFRGALKATPLDYRRSFASNRVKRRDNVQ